MLTIKLHNTKPALKIQFKDSSNAPMSLDETMVTMTMISSKGFVKIDKQIVLITDSANGRIQYQWQPNDTNEVGIFYIEFEITYKDNSTVTVPSSGCLQLQVIKHFQ